MDYPPTVEIGGIVVDNLSFTEAVQRILALAKERRSQYVVTPNADHIVKLQDDAAFREVYQGAALKVADGMPLIWVSKWFGTPLKARITGADLLPALCAEAARQGLSVYLLGGDTAAVAQTAVTKLTSIYAGLNIAGWYSPPYGFENNPTESAYIVSQINQCTPDIVFVGVGAPKQEFWISQHRTKINTGILLGVGIAIAFAAGTEKRAPRIMQQLGLEWLHRLLQDPRRLAKRYLKDLSFFWIAYRTHRRAGVGTRKLESKTSFGQKK